MGEMMARTALAYHHLESREAREPLRKDIPQRKHLEKLLSITDSDHRPQTQAFISCWFVLHKNTPYTPFEGFSKCF